MDPLASELVNVRTFAHERIEWPEGCVAILGDNGVGKTTAVNSIEWALFGPRKSWGPDGDAIAMDDADTARLELEFEHAGERYRVRRTYSTRGRGKATCDFEKWEADE